MVSFKAEFTGLEEGSKILFRLFEVSPSTSGALVEAEKIINTMIATRTVVPVNDISGDCIKVKTSQVKFTLMRKGDVATFSSSKLQFISNILTPSESDYATSEIMYGYIKNLGGDLSFQPNKEKLDEFFKVIDTMEIVPAPNSTKKMIDFIVKVKGVPTNSSSEFILTTVSGSNTLMIGNKGIRLS